MSTDGGEVRAEVATQVLRDVRGSGPWDTFRGQTHRLDQLVRQGTRGERASLTPSALAGAPAAPRLGNAGAYLLPSPERLRLE